MSDPSTPPSLMAEIPREEIEDGRLLAILDRGRIVSIGTPVELRASFGGPDLAAAFERAVGADRCH